MRFRGSRELFKSILRLFKRAPEQLELDLGASVPSKPKAAKFHKAKKVKQIPEFVRSELNLEQNAVFTVSTYRENSREITRIYKSDAGTMKRKVIIGKAASGAEVGILTTRHFKLYLVLLELWEKAGKPPNSTVHFTILQILKRLGVSIGGSGYESIIKALNGLRDIPIKFIDSFQENDGNFRSTGYLSVLSSLHIYERKRETNSGNRIYGYGEFRFDDHILMSLAENFVHPLRLDVITQFRKHKDTAILLYTYLDRQLAFKRKFEITLKKLYEQLDLSERYITYPSQRKLKIEPVLEQLRGKELSTGRLSTCRVEKTKDNTDYKLVCRKTGVTEIPEPAPVKLDWSLPLDDLLSQLNEAETK